MNFFKRLFKAVVIVLILAVFALTIWQNRVWLAEHGRPIWAQVKAWASKGTWNEQSGRQETVSDSQNSDETMHTQASEIMTESTSSPVTADVQQTEHADVHAENTKEMEIELADGSFAHPNPHQPAAAKGKPEIETELEIITEPGNKETVDNQQLVTTNEQEFESNEVESESPNNPIASVRQLVWAGKLDQAREMLLQHIEQAPENPALLWELLQLERYSQHMHQAARIQWRLQLLALKQHQEQQLHMLRQWQQQLGQQQAHLTAQIAQMEQDLNQTLEELRQPLEKQP